MPTKTKEQVKEEIEELFTNAKESDIMEAFMERCFRDFPTPNRKEEEDN